jgi:hypothetical protein
MTWLCHTANGAVSALDVANEIHAALSEDPPFDGDEGTIISDMSMVWQLMAGLPASGECHHQARLMNVMIQLMGVPGGTEHLIHASTDTDPFDVETTTAATLGVTVDLDGDGAIGETDEVLQLIFNFDPDQPEANWNNFEGTLERMVFYAVWPTLQASSGCRMLYELRDNEGAVQKWVYPVVGFPTYAHPGTVAYPICP